MTPATVRIAEVDDLAALTRLRHQWVEEQRGPSPGFDSADELLLRPHRRSGGPRR